MDMISALIGIIGILVGGFLYQRSRANNAQALNENIKTKEELNELDKTIAKNDGLLQSEEEKRAELEKQAQDEKAKEVTQEDLLKFLNDPNRK